MGRTPLLTEDVRKYVACLKRDCPTMTAKEVINKVKEYLVKSFPNPKDGLTQAEIEKIVTDEQLSETSIIKYNTELNHKLKQSGELDSPWHLGLLSLPEDHPKFRPEYRHLTSEAVRHILEAQEAMRGFFTEVAKATAGSENVVHPDDYRLTVRQALWVARLYDIVRNAEGPGKPRGIDDARMLHSIACNYADYELLCTLSETPFDTGDLDAALSKGLIPFFELFSGTEKIRAIKEAEATAMYFFRVNPDSKTLTMRLADTLEQITFNRNLDVVDMDGQPLPPPTKGEVVEALRSEVFSKILKRESAKKDKKGAKENERTANQS